MTQKVTIPRLSQQDEKRLVRELRAKKKSLPLSVAKRQVRAAHAAKYTKAKRPTG